MLKLFSAQGYSRASYLRLHAQRIEKQTLSWPKLKVNFPSLPKAWLDLETPYKVQAKHLRARSESIELGIDSLQKCGEILEAILDQTVVPSRRNVRMKRDYEEAEGKRKRLPAKPLLEESESSAKVPATRPAKKRRVAPRLPEPKRGYETEGNVCL